MERDSIIGSGTWITFLQRKENDISDPTKNAIVAEARWRNGPFPYGTQYMLHLLVDKGGLPGGDWSSHFLPTQIKLYRTVVDTMFNAARNGGLPAGIESVNQFINA